MQEQLLVLGRIVAPHGVRGELRIKPETDRPEMLAELAELVIGGRRYDLVRGYLHKGMLIATLGGVDTRDAAQALVGSWVELERDLLPPRPDGQYYVVDLIGLTVETDTGEFLGTIREVLSPGANDVFVVATEDGDLLLPALKRYVTVVDIAAGKVVTTRVEEWRAD